MALYADANYSFNPWMRDIQPQMRPDNDAIDMLEQQELIEAISDQAPMPPPAGYTPRLLGYERPQPGINEVLQVGPTGGMLLKDADGAGIQSSLRGALGAW